MNSPYFCMSNPQDLSCPRNAVEMSGQACHGLWAGIEDLPGPDGGSRLHDHPGDPGDDPDPGPDGGLLVLSEGGVGPTQELMKGADHNERPDDDFSWMRPRELRNYQQETTTVKKVAGEERDDLHNVYSFPVDKLLEAEDPEPDIHEDNQEERKGEEECCVYLCFIFHAFLVHYRHTIEKHRGQSQTSWDNSFWKLQL